MIFKKQNLRYLVNSLNIVVVWLIFYGATTFVYFTLSELLSNLYIMPIEGLQNFVWLEWYNKIFYSILVMSLIFNAIWVWFVLPFTNDGAPTKHAQFIVGFSISIFISLAILIVGLGVLLGLEAVGVAIYSGFCLIYFPLVFICSRHFAMFGVPSTYRAGYWFTGGKKKDKN